MQGSWGLYMSGTESAVAVTTDQSPVIDAVGLGMLLYIGIVVMVLWF